MPFSLKTRVTELLGCDYPIVQTGMGWVVWVWRMAVS